MRAVRVVTGEGMATHPSEAGSGLGKLSASGYLDLFLMPEKLIVIFAPI